MSPTYFIYCRAAIPYGRFFRSNCSTKSQERTLLKYARKEGLHVKHVFTEIGLGTELERPILSCMLHSIVRGEADAILVCDYSRLTRNHMEYVYFYDLLGRGVIKEIRTPFSAYTESDARKFRRRQSAHRKKYANYIQRMKKFQMQSQ